MSEIDDLLHRYATEAADIESAGTSAGYYTHYGLLATFAKDLLALPDPNDIEAPVTAIRDLRAHIRGQGRPYNDYSLVRTKGLIDEARESLDLPQWGRRPGSEL